MIHLTLALLLLLQGIPYPGPGTVGSHSGSGHTFTKVHAANFSCSSSPCTVNPFTTTAGNLVVIVFGTLGIADYITAVSNGGTWTIPSGCQANSASSATSISCAYIIFNTGASSFSLSYGSGTGTGTIYEFSYTGGGAVTLDGGANHINGASSATQAMVTPTITGTNDVFVQAIQATSGIAVNSFSGIYTTDQGGGTYGAVHLLNSTNTSAFTATLSSASLASICEVAFQ